MSVVVMFLGVHVLFALEPSIVDVEEAVASVCVPLKLICNSVYIKYRPE